MKMYVISIPLLHYSRNYIPTPELHIILFFQGRIVIAPGLELCRYTLYEDYPCEATMNR